MSVSHGSRGRLLVLPSDRVDVQRVMGSFSKYLPRKTVGGEMDLGSGQKQRQDSVSLAVSPPLPSVVGLLCFPSTTLLAGSETIWLAATLALTLLLHEFERNASLRHVRGALTAKGWPWLKLRAFVPPQPQLPSHLLTSHARQ